MYQKKSSYYGVVDALKTLLDSAADTTATINNEDDHGSSSRNISTDLITHDIMDDIVELFLYDDKWGCDWMIPELSFEDEEKRKNYCADTTKEGQPDWLQPTL
jgi:hypothetical protein